MSALRRVFAPVAAGLLAVALCTQALCGQDLGGQEPTAPKVALLTRIDGGLGGFLRLADGSRREFHVEVTERARLAEARMPGAKTAGLAFGSEEERELLTHLRALVDSMFSADEQQQVLAMPSLPSPRTEEEDEWHKQASLLRTLHRYERVTRPKIDKVFAGRGTVSMALMLQLGDDEPRQLLWRRFDDQEFAHMHFGTEVEPIALDSGTENDLLLALRIWLLAKLDGEEALWQPLPQGTPDEVRLVATAWRGYLEATSPRLRSSGVTMDAPRGGTRLFEIALPDRQITLRFDYRLNTATPGRLLEPTADKRVPVELGSARERELLDLLRLTAKRRRGWCKDPDNDTQLGMLEKELAAYDLAFPPAAAGK